MTSGIYHIIDKTSGRRYVGSSKNIVARWYRHRSSLRKGKHHSTHLQRVFDKYGEDNLYFLIHEICDEKQLVEREDVSLQMYVSLQLDMNGRKQASISGSSKGMKRSEETKKRMSEAQKGKPRTHKKRDWTDEQRRQNSESKKNKKRGPTSEETKKKLSESLKGKPCPNRGKKWSEEQRQKIIESRTGKKRGPYRKRLQGQLFPPVDENRKVTSETSVESGPAPSVTECLV